MKTLRFILGDQLSKKISSLSDCNKKNDVVFMCEVWEEATYVKHHKKKIIFLFSAMRHFSESLKQAGYNVDYKTLDSKNKKSSFTSELKQAITRHQPDQIVITFPGEYRVLQTIKKWEKLFSLPVDIRRDDRFLCPISEFIDWSTNRKQLRMEYFYREMRKKHNILMKSTQPLGGKWNFDSDNRKPPSTKLNPPEPYQVKPDSITQQVIKLVEQQFANHFGDSQPFHFAVTRSQALAALRYFIKNNLIHFGEYQDAMLQQEPWMYHSHIGLYINCGLLEPLECIQAVEEAYHKNKLPLNAIEGFIRQILGWREFVRGIYWLYMPEYAELNFLQHQYKLPKFFWDGNTKMNCLKQCIDDTQKNAYAHHIPRLMVLGNFLLLAGIAPKQVNEWYLIVYCDAYQWVELPNVSGMALFADGGYLASKPYAASGAYINKMSDYCKNCHFNVKEKTGESACPFNYLYWDFLLRHQDKLAKNPRLAMIYNTIKRMGHEKQVLIKKSAQWFFDQLSKNKI